MKSCVQLPPVCDTPVYITKADPPATLHGGLVWQNFDSAVSLSRVVRQNAGQQAFKDVLESLRTYTTTPEQAKWLQQFQWHDLGMKYSDELLQRMKKDGLFVFPSHALEWQHNTQQAHRFCFVCRNPKARARA